MLVISLSARAAYRRGRTCVSWASARNAQAAAGFPPKARPPKGCDSFCVFTVNRGEFTRDEI